VTQLDRPKSVWKARFHNWKCPLTSFGSMASVVQYVQQEIMFG